MRALLLLVLGLTGCATRAKAPLRIDPPSASERAVLASVQPIYEPVLHDPAPPDGVITIAPRGGPLRPESPPNLAPLSLASSPDSFLPDPPATLALAWPVPATGITSLFGPRVDPITGAQRFHYGVDLHGRYGQPVTAAAAGVVIFAGWNHGHGRQVIVQHTGGWQTSYSHLSQFTVHRGEHLRAGQAVGQLGNSGRSTGPHLHFEITRWGGYYNPLDLLGTEVPVE